MRLLIKLLLVLAASVAVVTLLGEGPGYVLVQVGGYTLETTAALAALALILVLAVGWEVWGMVAATWHLPAAFGQARERRHQRQSLEALEEGVLALERGEAQRARKLFARGARHAKAPAAFFMEAARAAHMAGDDERAEAFLTRAQQGGREEGAATLLRAEIEMDAGRGEHALALLSDLEKQESDNPRVIKRLLQLHREAEDWAALLELLPRAKQAGVVDAAEMEDELRRVRGRRMEQARLDGDGAAVEALWKGLDRDERTRPALLGPWVHYLVGQGRRDDAEKALDQGLRRHWQGELVELYLALPEAPGSAQALLNRLEKWLGDHPRDPHLLAVLAQLAVGAQLWGKADHYLEEARNLDEVPAGVLLRLASIYQERGAADQALACLRRGLSAWQGTAAALPVPFTASNR